jgi:two-component system NtrC family sensor kinase
VAFRWRIRHKLILGLGLVVAITALLLAGTFKGLISYMATMKTMGSKLGELSEANDFKEAVQDLVARTNAAGSAESPDPSDVPDTQKIANEKKRIADEKEQISAKAEVAKKALARYDEKLQDTLKRGRDPDNGYRPTFILKKLYQHFDHLKDALDGIAVAEGPFPNGGPPVTSAWDVKEIKETMQQLVEASNELQQAIYEDMFRCLEGAREEHRSSVWIVLTTSIVGVLMMTGLLRFFYTWVFFPIRDVEKGAGRVAQGDFDHRIDVHSGDEMEDLAFAFNNMTGRLREMYQDLARQVNERSRQLVRSERLAGVGFLAAGVAHEINNPLASIAFCSEALEARLSDLLAARGKVGPRLQREGTAGRDLDQDVIIKYLKMIQEEAFRCKEITERLLEFSRTGERRREPTDLAELVQSVLDMAQHLQNRKGKQVAFEPPGPVIAWVNSQEIKSVVLNLVVNALDSMEEGGTLAISLRQQHEMAEMVFSDTGCGMSAEVLENIFEPFFTRSRSGKGTGLGLTITHRIITQHGGEIEAASAGLNAGSMFTVRLPLQPVESNEQTGPNSDQHPGVREKAA